MKKLIPAIVLLLISAMIMATASYAWFSMNTTVTASGMSVTASTPLNILISDAASSGWLNSVNADETYTGKLLPASTADAKTFNAIMDNNYIGSNGAGGVAVSTTTFKQTSTVGALAQSTVTTGYFVTYTYALKLSEAQTEDATVYLSKLLITEKTGTAQAPDLSTAARVAVYTGATAGALTNLVGIYAINGATTSYSAVTGTVAADGTPLVDQTGDSSKDISTTTVTPVVAAATTGAITYADANKIMVNKDASTAQFVTLVVWIEGQDTACVNAEAGAQFDLVVDFSIKPAA